MEFSRQEYWSGLPCPSSGGFPDPETEPTSPALAGGFFTTEPPGKPIDFRIIFISVIVLLSSTWFFFTSSAAATAAK